jgi:hypothetical protein
MLLSGNDEQGIHLPKKNVFFDGCNKQNTLLTFDEVLFHLPEDSSRFFHTSHSATPNSLDSFFQI